MANLYIVGTPIGNMEDISLRAIRILKEVDFIACEDTRHSLILLNKYEIKKPLISYYMHKEKSSAEHIISKIKGGQSCALITDAGMPCISDPGAVLVKRAREEGVEIFSVPGASAVVSAMSISGIEKKGFCFLGFLPEKNKDKVNLVLPYKNIPITLAFYSSPHDVNSDLDFLYSVLGERKVYIIKEITKMFETFLSGELSTLRVETPKGEFVLLLEYVETVVENTIIEHYLDNLNKGLLKKDAIKQTANERKLPKDDVYKEVLNYEKENS